MGRPPCCDKANVKRGPWTADEDAKILAYVASHGIGNWTLVPEKAGLNRCGKSCRLRWTNYLRPNLRHDNFTPEEEECILQLHETIGNRWSMIAHHLPGRTDNDVKNYWNTKLKKKLEKMGIDPITHKPLAQVLTEYKKIGLPKSRNPKTISLHRESIMKAESQFVPPELSHSILMESNCFINNHPWSIMQFQANETINQETAQLHIFSELSSSASSASCSSLTPFSSPQSYPHEVSQVQVATTSSSPWNEYILGDPSFSTDTNIKLGGCEFQATPSNNQLASEENRIFLHEFTTESGNALEQVRQENGGPVQADHSLETTSSTVDSFVETILARHSKMRLEFPDLLDGCFDY